MNEAETSSKEDITKPFDLLAYLNAKETTYPRCYGANIPEITVTLADSDSAQSCSNISMTSIAEPLISSNESDTETEVIPQINKHRKESILMFESPDLFNQNLTGSDEPFLCHKNSDNFSNESATRRKSSLLEVDFNDPRLAHLDYYKTIHSHERSNQNSPQEFAIHSSITETKMLQMNDELKNSKFLSQKLKSAGYSLLENDEPNWKANWETNNLTKSLVIAESNVTDRPNVTEEIGTLKYNCNDGLNPNFSNQITVTVEIEYEENSSSDEEIFGETDAELRELRVVAKPQIIGESIFEIKVELPDRCYPGYLILVKPQNSLESVKNWISLRCAKGETIYEKLTSENYVRFLSEQLDLSCELVEENLDINESKNLPLKLILSKIPRISPRFYYLTSVANGIGTFNMRKVAIEAGKMGLATTYLSNLQPGDFIKAKVMKDTKLHWVSSNQAVLITSDFGATALRWIWLSCPSAVVIYHISYKHSLLYQHELEELHSKRLLEDLIIIECDEKDFLTQFELKHDLVNSVKGKVRSGAHVYVTGRTDFCLNLRALLSVTLGVETIKEQPWYHEDNGAYEIDY